MKIPAFIDSSETFAKSFDSFAILSSRNNPFRNIRSLHKPSFGVGLPRTVCESVCLSVSGKNSRFIHINYLAQCKFGSDKPDLEQNIKNQSIRRSLINSLFRRLRRNDDFYPCFGGNKGLD